ncbi:asparagine synthase (glutamine-hydrolyzing) [Bradyrhizobium sp. BWA-3-5]|uniref:asparagine synthase (glutamine-hydrolyzing) n=1 Tax=Bradyrhizobium sp. BWA-3-5 TaxID=3080013 RepID=UPI00293EFE66|nr:asparagine synthase (glutamine-hydrolyzing) [Bradyrhizobium sp. BWA-3-5]WOH68173.1 asparagine synthase (glutamine-hydrolyzing) [Bradyrhizobium sp. BWA-3-5]
MGSELVCGIFGLLTKNGPVDADQVDRLTDLVAHRGPDGRGVRVNGNVGLGHRRLAIIDLTDDGAQPMCDRHLPIWITYNGEIYNYLELRAELEALGHVFHTASDTEVLLAAYVRWGEKCLDRFNGMWSFAIHDERDNTLFCARDRFGVKPFYYVNTATQFAFGSEIRQLLPLIGRPFADDDLIRDFLVCGLTDHTNRTFFRSVEKLPPGHRMRVDVSTGRVEVQRYYSLAPRSSTADEADTARLLRDLLDDATRLRLRSDVRVGTCLSGGLDSSSIATLAARHYALGSNERFFAITAVSEQASNNEEVYAAEVAARSELNWLRTKPSYQDFASTTETLLEVQEEPFAGPSIMMQYEVMKTARSHGVIVLLDGQGGDETLLGYHRYYAAWLLDHFRRASVRGFLSAFSDAVRAGISPRRLLMYFFGAGSSTLREAFYRWRYTFLRNPDLPESLRRFARKTRDAQQMQILEITETNLPMLLRFEDKNSMRFGIETRLPFLDYRFVEFALSLPTRIKLNKGWAKWPLRAAMQDLLPGSISWRRDKIGFAAPDQLWLNQHSPAMYEKVSNSALLARYVDLAAVRKKFYRLDLGMRWRLYCVALWGERFGIEAP